MSRRSTPGRAVTTTVLLTLLALCPSEGRGQEIDPLANAERLFKINDNEGTAEELDKLIPLLDERRKQDPPSSRHLVRALELRARNRILLDDVDGARVEIESLLRTFPEHTPTSPPGLFSNLFSDIKRRMVGEIAVTAIPADAVIELDGRRLTVSGAAVIPVLAGPHTVTSTRLGYRSETRDLQVEAGLRLDVTIELRRTSAFVDIVTQPAGVEVFVNNVSRGTTQAGQAEARGGPSQRLRVTDLNTGSYALEFRRPCSMPEFRRLQVESLTDMTLEPVSLRSAVAEVIVESQPAGATVIVDGHQVGNAPIVLPSLCEGPHTVELRSGTGRFVRRLELRAGQKERLTGEVRPAFAMLPASGPLEDRGPSHELLLRVERALADTGAVTFFVPAARDAASALQETSLPSGWLELDPTGALAAAAATAMTPRDRVERGTALSRALAVQGVATLTAVPTSGDGRILLAVLAMGSGEPDVMDVTLADDASVARARALLGASPVLSTRSTGLVLMDVIGLEGALVASVDKAPDAGASGVKPGDLIIAAGGRSVSSVAEFENVRDGSPLDQPLSIDVRRGSQSLSAAVGLSRIPFLMSADDQTLLFNKLLVERRAADAALADPFERSLNSLHQAVALIRGKNWREALGLLDRVTLPEGGTISAATVAYLRGLCFEGLNQPGSAEAAFKEAARDPSALLTHDGPSIKPLAEEKLKAATRH